MEAYISKFTFPVTCYYPIWNMSYQMHSTQSDPISAYQLMQSPPLFIYCRKSTFGSSVPSWEKPGPVYVRNHAKSSKHGPSVIPVTFFRHQSSYADVRLLLAVETTGNVRDKNPNNLLVRKILVTNPSNLDDTRITNV